MKQRFKIYYTHTQKAMNDVETLEEGWIPPADYPAIRPKSFVDIANFGRNRRHTPCRNSGDLLTLTEYEERSCSLAAGHSIRSIARLLNWAPATVSRETNCNGGCLGSGIT